MYLTSNLYTEYSNKKKIQNMGKGGFPGGSVEKDLVWEDPTGQGATKPMCQNYWVQALELGNCNYWAHRLQQLPRPVTPRAPAPQQETPLQWKARAPPPEGLLLAATGEKPGQHRRHSTAINNFLNVILTLVAIIGKCLYRSSLLITGNTQ